MTDSITHNKLSPIIVILLTVGAFLYGSLTTKVKLLEERVRTGSTAPITGQPANPIERQQVTKGVASVDDDPIIGDKNAPVTIIEFSDYECPFCKRHFDNTFPQIVKTYVETGKVKIVFRDFPLDFHEPMASKEAIAASCARDQGGDNKYFEFHHEIFKRTTSNGNGLDDAKLQTIARDLKLNMSTFNSCLTNSAKADEVKKDIADGSAAGASGTPTFLIGKSTDDGTISGDLIVGAQPFTAFQAIIDPLLN